ncbi:MAG: hypothetical protein CL661_09375 [Bacteroidetes bacterium]|nr:hypothetical protein [Bacteroidota bacterium]
MPSSVIKAQSEEECEPCSSEQAKKEFDKMKTLYINAVANAKSAGFLWGNHDDYDDSAWAILRGTNTPGNCADWAGVVWRALASKTWNCWRIVKIRARRKFWFQHHNFVYIEPKCGGDRQFFDPWRDGLPTIYTEDNFKNTNRGFWGNAPFSGWNFYPKGDHLPGSPPIKF